MGVSCQRAQGARLAREGRVSEGGPSEVKSSGEKGTWVYQPPAMNPILFLLQSLLRVSVESGDAVRFYPAVVCTEDMSRRRARWEEQYSADKKANACVRVYASQLVAHLPAEHI